VFGEFWGAAVLVKKKQKKIGICRIFDALTWTVEQDEALLRLCLLCWLVGRFVASEIAWSVRGVGNYMKVKIENGKQQ